MDEKRLIDVFPDWATTGGIFAALQELDVPWKTSGIASNLDLEYYGNVSGEKRISPLISKIMSGDSLSAAEQTLLATTILALNGANWGKEWATLSAVYNPIENYSMVETMTNDITEIEYGRTNERTDDLAGTSKTSVYGFNSSETPVDSGEMGTTNTGKVTSEDSGTDTHTRNYELTRTGNIGVTTSQQMLQSERDLWLWNFFRNIVFPDLDRVLALRIY